MTFPEDNSHTEQRLYLCKSSPETADPKVMAQYPLLSCGGYLSLEYNTRVLFFQKTALYEISKHLLIRQKQRIHPFLHTLSDMSSTANFPIEHHLLSTVFRILSFYIQITIEAKSLPCWLNHNFSLYLFLKSILFKITYVRMIFQQNPAPPLF